MQDYMDIFLKDNLSENALIAFYNTFNGYCYIKNECRRLREEKVLKLWEEYKNLPLPKKKIFQKIANEVKCIMPKTTYRNVRYIIHGK